MTIDERRTAHVNANDDETDLLTKVLPFGEKRRRFVRKSVAHHRLTLVLWMVTHARKRHAQHHISFCFYFYLYLILR